MREGERLVRRMKAGERRAFEEFVDSYGPRVHRLVLRHVPNPADADDVTQDIFVDVFRCIGGFRGDSALMTWVYRLALNHCLKRRQRAHPDSLPYEDGLVGADRDWRVDPAATAAKHELCDRVHRALGTLTAEHRDVVILHELHGFTYQECADALSIPVGTVKSRLSNGFKRLRSALGGYVLGDARTNPEPAGEMSR